MAADQMSAFVAAALADPAVRHRLSSATTADHVVAVAADLGYEVTAEEVTAAAQDLTSRELSDAELAGVGGGGTPSLDPSACPTGDCQSMYGLGC